MADPWLEQLAVDYDEDQHWIVLRRGRLRIACNLGERRVRGSKRPPARCCSVGVLPTSTPTAGTLPGQHSVVIVRTS